MNKTPKNDPFLNLADALATDIIAASEEALLAETAEDYGDAFALSAKFDKIVSSLGPREPFRGPPPRTEPKEARVIDLKAFAAESGTAIGEKPSKLLLIGEESSGGSLTRFGGGGGQPIPLSRPSGRPKRSALPQWFRMAATMLLGIGLGFAATMTLQKDTAGNWREAVADHQSLYSSETLTSLSGDLAAQADAIEAVSAKIGLPIAPESLLAPGLEFKRAQVLKFKGQPFAQFAYIDGNGNPVTFAATGTKDADSPAKIGTYHGLQAVSWNKHGYGFILIGQAPIAELQRAAAALEAQV